ncbi:MAG: hypothetical protein LBG52_06230 [Candidatus Peribacteria bacterium]|jgi:hypothetical protein|nr:hypothetical protein [Candidatus Peribacteria bacterium]
MPDLTYRQEKIQDKRKQTPFRDFVMEIASRYGYAFYKNAGTTSRFSPYQTRIPIHPRSVYDETDHTKTRGEWSGNFFADIQILFSQIGIPSNFLVGSENATHADNIGWSKNVYLSTSVGASENVLYSSYIKTQCTDVLNSLWIIKNCNVVYQSV